MKKVVLFFALIVGLLASASTMQAQNDNYITLKVKKDSVITLKFMAAAENTSIQLSIGGGISPVVLVGTSWSQEYSFTAHSNTIKIYNALTGLDCSNNKGNITGIDLSQSKQLVTLYCGRNNLTTDALDAMYCSLPIRQASDNAVIYPLYYNGSQGASDVFASNAQNATSKNWKVQYIQNHSDIPTTGTYTCPQLNMNSYITLTVEDNIVIDLDFWGAANATPIRIVNGSETEDIIVGTRWEGTKHFTTNSTTMTIYGDLKRFECAGNGANITALDVSHSPKLETLLCQGNRISSLDVSKNPQLTRLLCFGNNLTTSAIDDIYCSLPDRTGNTDGVIEPVYDPSYSDNATVFATNAQNAIAKNWKVQYSADNADITTTGTYTCPQLNMSRYITLTVKKDSAIKLNFKAAAAGTPVRIVSGSNTQNITVGTNWIGTATYTAGSTTMTIYGDLTGFGCRENNKNLTALDASKNTLLKELYCKSNYITDLYVSKNTNLEALNCSFNKFSSLNVSGCTQLTELICYHNENLSTLNVSGCSQLRKLYCYGSNLSTQALDDIFCALPDRTGKDNGVIDPVYNSSSSNHATVLATNKTNATAKNWKVRYSSGSADIPATTGTYTCPQLNMSRYITLTVKNGEAIKLDLWAAAAGTPVRIVSGSNTQDITVGTSWTGFTYYTADGTTMTVYGDLKYFDCLGNGENLTAIDVSNSPELEWLLCRKNRISSLDLSKNTKLTTLACEGNQLRNLDISKNTQLTNLYCFDNKLTALDVSKNTLLKELICHGNNFSTQVLDDIFCALPDRTGKDNGVVKPIGNSSSPDLATVLATNKANATAKNWKVQYYDKTDIPATTGKHKCSATTDIAEASAEQALTLYPNPVADVLYLSATARTVRIYNIYGIEVAHATDTDRIDVANLPAGVYTVRADGTVAKMVKR